MYVLYFYISSLCDVLCDLSTFKLCWFDPFVIFLLSDLAILVVLIPVFLFEKNKTDACSMNCFVSIKLSRDFGHLAMVLEFWRRDGNPAGNMCRSQKNNFLVQMLGPKLAAKFVSKIPFISQVDVDSPIRLKKAKLVGIYDLIWQQQTDFDLGVISIIVKCIAILLVAWI
jgi:hypothetical protein